MSKPKRPAKIDADSPEWTAEDSKRALTFAQLPAALRRTLAKRGRPPKEAPKQAVSIRLSPDVLAHFKAGGKGWQTKIDEVLRQWVKRRRAA